MSAIATYDACGPNYKIDDHYLIKVLDKYFCDNRIDDINGVCCEKWIAVSSLQKSIRRGHVRMGSQAAVTLLSSDPDYLFRRLPIIAYEDIGIADPLLCAVTSFVAKKTVRISYGDKQLGLLLTGLLAKSLKSRTATDIYCLTLSDPDSSSYLHNCLKIPAHRLPVIAVDTSLPLTRRMMALKVIAGFSERRDGRYPEVVSKPRLDLLQTVCEEMQASPLLTHAVMEANGKTECLNAALLLADEMRLESPTARVLEAELPCFEVKGINTLALDMYCRAGKTVISRWLQSSQSLQDFFKRIGVRNPTQTLGAALFINEGSLLDRELEFIGREETRKLIEGYEMQQCGITSPVMMEELNLLMRQATLTLDRLRKNAI